MKSIKLSTCSLSLKLCTTQSKVKRTIFSPYDNFLKEKESNQMVAKEIETDDEDEDSEDYEVYSEMD